MKNFDERTGGTTIPRKLRITYVQFFVLGIYFEKLSGYTDNINRKGEYQRGDQMNAEQRIRLIGIIEKIEKNPEFSNKLGLKNTFYLISEK